MAKEYLVQNMRARRLIRLFGKILTSKVVSSRNQAGTMWLTEEQYQSTQVQRLLELNRLSVVQEKGGEEVPPPPAPKTAPAPKKEAPVPPPAPAEAPDPTPPSLPEKEESSGAAVVQADGDIVPEADADEEGAHVYSLEELEELTLPFLRPIAKKAGLSIRGKKSEIIQSILDAQDS